MTKEEKMKMVVETKEFEFLKDIPADTLWKLFFALKFIDDEQDIKTEKHKWKECYNKSSNFIDIKYVCTCCNSLSDFKTDFCPNCGADMRGNNDTTT